MKDIERVGIDFSCLRLVLLACGLLRCRQPLGSGRVAPEMVGHLFVLSIVVHLQGLEAQHPCVLSQVSDSVVSLASSEKSTPETADANCMETFSVCMEFSKYDGPHIKVIWIWRWYLFAAYEMGIVKIQGSVMNHKDLIIHNV